MTQVAAGRWGARSSERAGARDMAMDAAEKIIVEYEDSSGNRKKIELDSQGYQNWLKSTRGQVKVINTSRKAMDDWANDFAMDPLTSKGEEIMKNMQSEYGPKKGESVFYASANKGTIKGVHGDMSGLHGNTGHDGRWGGRSARDKF